MSDTSGDCAAWAPQIPVLPLVSSITGYLAFPFSFLSWEWTGLFKVTSTHSGFGTDYWPKLFFDGQTPSAVQRTQRFILGTLGPRTPPTS